MPCINPITAASYSWALNNNRNRASKIIRAVGAFFASSICCYRINIEVARNLVQQHPEYENRYFCRSLALRNTTAAPPSRQSTLTETGMLTTSGLGEIGMLAASGLRETGVPTITSGISIGTSGELARESADTLAEMSNMEFANKAIRLVQDLRTVNYGSGDHKNISPENLRYNERHDDGCFVLPRLDYDRHYVYNQPAPENHQAIAIALLVLRNKRVCKEEFHGCVNEHLAYFRENISQIFTSLKDSQINHLLYLYHSELQELISTRNCYVRDMVIDTDLYYGYASQVLIHVKMLCVAYAIKREKLDGFIKMSKEDFRNYYYSRLKGGLDAEGYGDLSILERQAFEQGRESSLIRLMVHASQMVLKETIASDASSSSVRLNEANDYRYALYQQAIVQMREYDEVSALLYELYRNPNPDGVDQFILAARGLES